MVTRKMHFVVFSHELYERYSKTLPEIGVTVLRKAFDTCICGYIFDIEGTRDQAYKVFECSKKGDGLLLKWQGS